jgi:hypothetical protein
MYLSSAIKHWVGAIQDMRPSLYARPDPLCEASTARRDATPQ